jgi:tRNA A-37 threonylcarbamoyl transferase component Bud32
VTPAATAEPPHVAQAVEESRAAQAAEESHAAQAVPLAGALAAMPLGGEGIAWLGDSRIVRELLAERSAAGEGAGPAGRATVVKSGPHRSVYRVELPSATVFLKHFKIADWRALARNILLGSPAQREAAAAAQIAQAGIETTVSAAVGATRTGLVVRESFLVTREIAGSAPLNQVLRERLLSAEQRTLPPDAPRFRRDLARALGQLTGRLHRHGLTHGDLHLANILIRIRADGEVCLSLIDLQRVRRHVVLPFRWARHDLFGLYNSFNGVAGRAERRRFLNAYWLEAAASDSRLVTSRLRRGRGALGRMARRLEAFFARALGREQIQNDRKWQRPNSRLIVADRDWQRARGLSALGPTAILKYRDDPDALFEAGTIRFWRRRTRDSRAALVNFVIAGKTVVCEVRETVRRLGWRDLFFVSRWSATRRAWEMGHALRRRQIGAARPLLYIQSRTLARVREFLVVEPDDGMVTLGGFLAHRLASLSAAEREGWIDQVSRRLATQLARLHQSSLVHGRLSAANVLVGTERDDTRVQIAAVEYIVQKGRIKAHDLVLELARLEASVARVCEIGPAHRVRFLRACLGTRDRAKARRIWKGVKKELTERSTSARASLRAVPVATGPPHPPGEARQSGGL